MTHPLLPTQEQLVKWDSEYFDEEGENGERQSFDSMMIKAFQAGADQQLEQVIEWLKANPIEDYVWADYTGAIVKEQEFLENFKKAMRPQQEDC